MVNGPEAAAEWAIIHVRFLVDLNKLRLLTVFLTLRSDERDGETRSDNRDVRSQLEQPRNSTNVVLVRVGDDEGLDLVDLLLNRAKVRQN